MEEAKSRIKNTGRLDNEGNQDVITKLLRESNKNHR